MNGKKFISLKNIFIVTIFLLLDNLSATTKDLYNFSWLDSDKEIFVLQNRKFKKVRRLFLSLGGGVTTSGSFIDSLNIQLRAGYFIMENFGIEFLYSQNDGKENSNAKIIRNNQGIGTVPFRRIVKNYMGGLLLWSPFYAKINTFNSINYLDWIVGIGAGKLTDENNILELQLLQDTTPTIEKHVGILGETTLQFYLSKRIGIRMDLLVFAYQSKEGGKDDGKEKNNFNYDLSLSMNFLL